MDRSLEDLKKLLDDFGDFAIELFDEFSPEEQDRLREIGAEPVDPKITLSLNSPLPQQLNTIHEAVEKKNMRDLSLYRLPGDIHGSIIMRDGEYRYQPYNEEALNAALCKWVAPVFVSAKGEADEKPYIPSTVVRAYIGQAEFRGVPPVRRLAPAPVVGDDLSVEWEVGYFPAAKTFVTKPRIGMFGVGEVTEEDARAAGAYLRSWLHSFALEDRNSEADVLALAMTPLLMPYLGQDPVPGGIFIASKEGSGKTQLAQMVSIMSTGTQTTPWTWPRTDQMRTTITTILKGSSVVTIFDNVRTDLESDALESLLTSRTWKDRKFHSQDSMELPNDTLWLFTKNTPSLSPDMLRRLILVPLDKFNTDTTWDPEVLTKALRAKDKISEAMIKIITYWNQVGRPVGETFSGFEKWSQTVSGILAACGVDGFGKARTASVGEVYTEDEDDAEVINRLEAIFGDSVWTSANLVDACQVTMRDAEDDPLIKDKLFLKEWIRQGSSGSSRGVGRLLSRLNGKQMGGTPLYLKRLEGSRAKYKLKPRADLKNVTWEGMLNMANESRSDE